MSVSKVECYGEGWYELFFSRGVLSGWCFFDLVKFFILGNINVRVDFLVKFVIYIVLSFYFGFLVGLLYFLFLVVFGFRVTW